MGDNIQGNLIMKTLDGKEIHLENCIITEITELKDNDFYNELDSKNYISNINYEASVGLKTNIKRKRFIKLLMSRGLQKNEAVQIANYSLRNYGYYNQLLFLYI